MIKIFLIFVVFAEAVLLTALSPVNFARAAEIKVLSSPSARSALQEITPQFERATGHRLQIDFATIAILKDRIAAGAAFDVTIVGPQLIDELLQQGKIAAGTRSNIGRTGLGVVIRKGGAKPDISSVDAFRRTLLNAKSVTYSATGQSGTAFLSVIDRLGIANEMKPKLIKSDVASPLESGEADLGVTGIGAALASLRIEYVGAIPSELQIYVNVTAGVSTNAKEPEGARALVKYLNDPAIVSILRSKGLEPF